MLGGGGGGGGGSGGGIRRAMGRGEVDSKDYSTNVSHAHAPVMFW